MSFSFEGKLAIVTGSTAGIGKAIAKKFVVLGGSVVVNGRSEAAVTKVVEELNSVPGKKGTVFGVAADLGTKAGSDAFISKVAEVTGNRPIDVLVNNLGIFEPKAFDQITDEEWDRFFQVNVMSGVRMCRYYFKQMLARNSGSIVFIASEAAFAPKEFMIHYSMTKAAQVSISRGLAEAAKGTKVRVNTVMPGPTLTEGIEEYLAKMSKERNVDVETLTREYVKQVEPTSLIQRFIQPEEVANMVAVIASDLATAVTGSSVRCEGGILKYL